MRGESKNEGVFFDLYKKEIPPRIAPEWDQVAKYVPAPTPVRRYATSCFFTMRPKGSIVYNNEVGGPFNSGVDRPDRRRRSD